MLRTLKQSFSFAATIGIPFFYLYLLFIMVATKDTMHLPIGIVIGGIIMSFIGSFLWITSMIQLRNVFGVLPQKQKRFKSGLYKYFKHPMYLGIMISYLGLSVSAQTFPGLALTLCLLLPLLIIRAYFEEKALLSDS